MQVVDQNCNATLNEYMNASHMRKFMQRLNYEPKVCLSITLKFPLWWNWNVWLISVNEGHQVWRGSTVTSANNQCKS